jgi:hypothetical protein
VSFAPAPARYTVDVPEGWARTDASNHVHFNQKLIDIDIALETSALAPTQATAQAESRSLARSNPCFKLAEITTVTRRSGPALRIAYQVDSAPAAVTGKLVRDDVERYELWHAGTKAVITLSAPAGSDNVDVWRRITDSFAWK